jgi:hypothetical protein
MIPHTITFSLPKPWEGQQFHRDEIGAINFLVGPNGSGKSRFANTLKNHLPRSRILGTDRLEGMGVSPLSFLGDNFTQGYQKSWFGNFKGAGANFGSGIDSFIILEERPDIRIMVEATLSNLFNRNITIEWNSGNLVPKATSGRTGEAYRIDKDECHGIKELLVLLTHLYNDEYDYLIVDEPELNLHPQFQSLFMQEVRKLAGVPDRGSRKKCIFLITHSPFMIDLRSMDDLSSVISFSSDHSIPVSIAAGSAGSRLVSLIPRLNVHHKQLFFQTIRSLLRVFSMHRLSRLYKNAEGFLLPPQVAVLLMLEDAKRSTNIWNFVVPSESRPFFSMTWTACSQAISDNALKRMDRSRTF